MTITILGSSAESIYAVGADDGKVEESVAKYANSNTVAYNTKPPPCDECSYRSDCLAPCTRFRRYVEG